MAYARHDVKPLGILHGQRNGELDASILVTIKDHNPQRGADMTFNTVAARAWVAMSAAARAAGHDLLPTDMGFGTYRTLHQQEVGFRFHYTTDDPGGNRPTKFWDGQTWFLKPRFEPAATPGQSNHGLGLAIDVANLSTAPAPSDARSRWVLDNYERFGFSHEFKNPKTDPCHIRYFAGDEPPPDVLQVDPPSGHVTTTRNFQQITEDDMLPIITNLEATRGVGAHVIKFALMDDGRLRVLGEDEWRVRGALEGTGWTNEQIAAAGVL